MELNSCPATISQSSHGEGHHTLSRKRKSDCAFGGLYCAIKPANKKTNVVAEQMRKNRMKFLCAKLQSLIPTTTLKVDRCGLYEEASNYIRKLKQEVFHLRQQRNNLRGKACHGKTGKESREVQVDVGIYGSEVVITITSITRPKCFGRMIEEIEQHGVDVNMSQLSTSDFFVFLYFHASLKDNEKEHNPAKLQSSLERRLSMAY
ncbi:hypothetical protein SUGI_0006770 [Cryptomeria japonica]|uniref:uncharacterized protein LOC131060268 n=1 Tax=Cryptomeria japonica TaxID=3369 RepID=UPI002408BD06|nr:uncharacterized protein LOC131060268 [Cryptomeria japonica]XP_059077946.1 uncharacterized protein LOC131060268 [Cryptomeria japonica]GLJ04926.1 hypothetical protein SUGI_0006770 [Cryptomeria japonica]